MSDTLSLVSGTLADAATLDSTPGSIADPNFYNDVANFAVLSEIDPNLDGQLMQVYAFEQSEIGWYNQVDYYASIGSPVDPSAISVEESNIVATDQVFEQDFVADLNAEMYNGGLSATVAGLFPISVSPDGTAGVVAPAGPNGTPTPASPPDPNSMPDPTVPEAGLVSEGLGPLILPQSTPVGIVVGVAFQNTAGAATQYVYDAMNGAPQSVLTADAHNVAATFGSDVGGFIGGKVSEGLGVPVSTTTQATPAIPITAAGGVEIGNQVTAGINAVLNQNPTALTPPGGPGVVAPAGPSSVSPSTTTPTTPTVVPGVIAPNLGLSSQMSFFASPSVNPATFDVAQSGPTSSVAINNVIAAVTTLTTDPNPADFLPNVDNLALANLNAEYTGAELAILHGASYADATAALANSLDTAFNVPTTTT